MTVLLLISMQIAVFGVLVFILKSVTQRQFGEASSRLEVLTRESEERLTEAKKKVKEADLYHEEVLARSKEEGDKVRQQLIDEGLKEKQDILDRAHKESEAIMERARSARKLLEENWNQELTGKARELTLHVLQTVLPSKFDQSLQSEWVKESLKEDFDGLSHLNIPDHVTSGQVVSALPLTETQKKALIERLAGKIGRRIDLEEQNDEKLILGFCLSLGPVVIDCSLAWRVKEALRNEEIGKEHGPI